MRRGLGVEGGVRVGGGVRCVPVAAVVTPLPSLWMLPWCSTCGVRGWGSGGFDFGVLIWGLGFGFFGLWLSVLVVGFGLLFLFN